MQKIIRIFQAWQQGTDADGKRRFVLLDFEKQLGSLTKGPGHF